MPNPNREHLPIPAVLTPENFVCFQIRIPHDSEHLAAFWGAVEALAQRYTWGKPLSEDSEIVADYWRVLIDENRECYEGAIFMANGNCGCCDDPIYRFTADGVREVSHDGGETWEVDPSDPRISGDILPPPPWLIIPGDHSCEGAITGAVNMHFMIDEILTSGATGVSSLYETIAAIICVFSAGAACIAAQLVAALAVVITQLTATYIDSVMTDEVYDEFQCILLCHIQEDATFTEAGWSAVKTDINESDMNADAKFVLWQLVNAMGAMGLTNMCRLSVTVSGDCDDCPGCTPCENFTIENGTLIDHPSEFVWEVGSVDDGFGQQVIIINFGGSETECCFIDDRVITGAAPFETYWECNDADGTGGSPVNHCIWRHRINTGVGGAGFSVLYTTSECP